MSKNFLFKFLCFITIISSGFLFSCSNDDDNSITPDNQAKVSGINNSYSIKACDTLMITPKLDGFESSVFQWTISNAELGIKDSFMQL